MSSTNLLPYFRFPALASDTLNFLHCDPQPPRSMDCMKFNIHPVEITCQSPIDFITAKKRITASLAQPRSPYFMSFTDRQIKIHLTQFLTAKKPNHHVRIRTQSAFQILATKARVKAPCIIDHDVQESSCTCTPRIALVPVLLAN